MNWPRTAFRLAALAAWGLAAAAGGQSPDGSAVKGFRLPEYDEEGRLKQQLYGETATFLPDGIIQLTGVKIEIFRDGEVTARIYSPACAYDQARKRAASKEHIRIVVDKGVVTGDGFAWNGTNQQFQIFQNAKVVLASQMDKNWLAPRPAPGTEPATTEE